MKVTLRAFLAATNLLSFSLAFLASSRVAATSNINSIWLSTSEKTSKSAINNKHQNKFYHNSEGDTHNTYAANNAPEVARLGEQWQPASKVSSALEASSSSHRPSIVALEEKAGSNKQRRSDFLDLQPAPKTSGNFSDEAGSSVENSWSGNPQNRLSSPASNAEVQFDDLIRLTNSSNERRADPEDDHLRQLLNQTSNEHFEAPAHQPSFSSEGALNFGAEFPEEPPDNSSQPLPESHEGELVHWALGGGKTSERKHEDLPSEANRSEKRQDSPQVANSSAAPEPFIYYLPNGDKWNYSPAPPELGTETSKLGKADSRLLTASRRKLHNTGTQYDLRESDEVATFAPAPLGTLSASNPPLPPALYQPESSSSWSSEPDGSIRRQYQLIHAAGAQELLGEKARKQTVYSSALAGERQPNRQLVPIRRPTGPIYQIPSGFLVGRPNEQFAAAGKQFKLSAANGAKPLVGLKEENRILFPVDHFKSPRRDEQGRLLIQPPNYNHWPATSLQSQPAKRKQTGRVKQDPEAGKSSGGLFKYITKPKRSLLNVFSNVIGGGKQQQENLEASFYESGRKQADSLKPGTWNLANSQLEQLPPSASVLQSITQPFQAGQDGGGELAGGGHFLHAPQHAGPQFGPAPFLRPAIAYYPSASSNMHSGAYQQMASIESPTVSPAPSSLNRYAHHYYQQATLGRRRRVPPAESLKGPARGSFIPVVAVQVTKTSPAPRVPEETGESGENSKQLQESTDASSALINDYLESKLASGTHNKYPSRQQPADEYGNLASGSHSSKTINKQPQAKLPPGQHQPEHTTTVKSALFGYLPHQAQQPFLQALNILPEYAASASTGQQDSTGAGDYEQQQQRPVEEAPSLALQLQANSVVQNDIAPSYYDYNQIRTGGLNNVQAPRQLYAPSGQLPVRHAFELYPTQQAQLHGFQLLPNAPEGVHPSQAAGYNPLLAYSAEAAANLPGGQLLSSASEVPNQLLPFMYANPAGNGMGRPAEEDSDGDQEKENSEGEESQQQQLKQQVSRGRKRSSNFFANAGQILLSALPILLAPTLGLMFASPNSVAARYQPTPGSPLAPPAPASLGSASSLPSSYVSGEVVSSTASNSPAPKLFTQSPLEFGYPSNLSGNAQATSANKTKRLKPKTTPSPQKPTAIILTTLGPPPFANETNMQLNTSGAGDKTAGSQHAKQTIMLITEQELDSLASNNSAEALQVAAGKPMKGEHPHYDIGGYEGADFDAQFASLRKHFKPQEAELWARRPNSSSLVLTNHHLVGDHFRLGGYKWPGNITLGPAKNQYQYAEVITTSPEAANEMKLLLGEPNDTTTTTKSLFPVTTWPPMRRKTVSLVTSNGSKTLIDSSDKYHRLPLDFALKNASSSFARDANYSAVSNFDEEHDDDDDDRSAPDRGQDRGDQYSSLSARRAIAKGDSSVGRPKLQTSARSSHLSSAGNRLTSHELDLIMSEDLVGEPQQPKRKRLRRETSATSAEAQRKLVKVVKRVIRVPAGQALNGTGHLEHSESALKPTRLAREQPKRAEESLKGDASGSKAAHIITTMITQADEPAGQEEEPGAANATAEEVDYHSSVDVNQVLEAVDELKEQALRKKLALDRQEERERTSSASQADEERLEFEPARRANSAATKGEQFSSGGRGGRIPIPTRSTVPIEVTSTKIRLFPSEALNSSSSSSKQTKHKDRRLVLNEDTRKALVNFGSLLMKDTLGGSSEREEARSRAGSRSKAAVKFRRELDRPQPQRASSAQQWDHFEPQLSSATESSFTRTTPMPGYSYTYLPDSDARASLNLSHQYYPRPGALPAEHQEQGLWSARGDRVNLIEGEEFGGSVGTDDRVHAGSGPLYHPPSSAGDYYQANGHTNGYAGDRGPYANDSDYHQPNYTTAAEHRIRPDRSPGSSLAAPPASQEVYSYNSYYPPPRPYGGHNYEQPPARASNRLPAGYSSQEHHYNSSRGYYNQQKGAQAADYAPDNYYRPPPGPPLKPLDYQPQFPPVRGPPYPLQEPGGGAGFAADAYQPGRRQPARYHSEAPSSPSASSLPFQSGPLAMVSSLNERGDSKQVNDYLKRVHFSDSDRDKLMASYLTCDGLLNDNDHCLERLSCEFSDPQNIEKANKLDRAVSSILLGHILINTYIPNNFKLRLKSASLYGYTQSGKCSRFVCNKLTKSINSNNHNANPS